MNRENLKKALLEVDVILKEIIPKKQTEKIPKKLIEFINENKDLNHSFEYDYSKELDQQNILNETKIFIGILYLNYWSTEKEKIEINQILDDNEKKYLKELNNKYSTENLFKKKDDESNNTKETQNLPMEYKETLIKKIIKFIRKMFKKG